MPDATIHKAKAFEDGPIALMARVIGSDGSNITQSSVTAVTYAVYELDEYGDKVKEITAPAGLTVSDVVFNSLQTNAHWDADSTGYNFRHDLPAASLPEAKTYQVEYRFTPAGGGDAFPVVWHVEAAELMQS